MELRYNNKFGDLSLNTSLIYGYNHNEVRGLIQEQDFLTSTTSYNIVRRSEIGHPINSIYGYVMEEFIKQKKRLQIRLHGQKQKWDLSSLRT